jgi:hypothetical protein
MKKKRKEELKRDFKIGAIMGMIVVAVGLLGGIFVISQSPYFGMYINQLSLNSFNHISLNWQDDNLVTSVVDACSLQSEDKMKLICVYTFVSKNVNYTKHGINNQLRASPEEIISIGGNCRDYAVLYKSILDKMNISNKFITEPEHIYNEVYIGNTTYILDQGLLGEVQ